MGASDCRSGNIKMLPGFADAIHTFAVQMKSSVYVLGGYTDYCAVCGVRCAGVYCVRRNIGMGESVIERMSWVPVIEAVCAFRSVWC